MKNLRILAAGVFALLLISAAAAQEPISPEKRKLIAELITVTKTDEQLRSTTDIMLRSMERSYPLIFEESLSGMKNLSPAQRKQLGAQMAASFRSISTKFRERLPQRINYSEYIEKSVYPLYDKHFTASELQDMVDFYRSPTGQKTITEMPSLLADSAKMAEENLTPPLIQLMKEIIAEELAALAPPLQEDIKK